MTGRSVSQCTGFFSFRLIEQNLQEDVGVDQHSQSLPMRQREIWCWRSTAVF